MPVQMLNLLVGIVSLGIRRTLVSSTERPKMADQHGTHRSTTPYCLKGLKAVTVLLNMSFLLVTTSRGRKFKCGRKMCQNKVLVGHVHT